MSERIKSVALELGVYLASLAVLVALSWVTGPSFAELGRLEAVARAESLVVNLVDHGIGVLVSSSAMRIYDEAAPHGTWPTLVSGWVSVAARQNGTFDLLTAQRFGHLLVAALLPLGVVWISVRSLGYGLAVTAAALVLVQPNIVHAAVVATDDARIAAAWLAVFGAYVRSLPGEDGRARMGWSAVTALLLGVLTAAWLATLWVVVAIVVHFAALERGQLRAALARGRLPMPGTTLLALVITPMAILGTCPNLWRGGASKVARFLLDPIGAEGAPTLYRGELIATPPFPPTEAVHAFVARMPTGLLVLAVLGLGVWVRTVVERHRAQDPVGLGLATALFLAGGLVGPALTPPLLAAFPARIVAAMVFASLAVVVFLEDVARRLPGAWARPALLVGAVAVSGAVLLREPATAGAHFGLAVGGARGVLESEAFPPSDGSELGVLPEVLGPSEGPVRLAEGPSTYFDVLKARDRPAPATRGRARLKVVRGAVDERVAEITHQGAVVWSVVPIGS